jgi:hypothetical protein
MAAVITMITGGMLPDDDTAITHAKKVIIQLSRHDANCEGHTIPFGEESKLAEH